MSCSEIMLHAVSKRRMSGYGCSSMAIVKAKRMICSTIAKELYCLRANKNRYIMMHSYKGSILPGRERFLQKCQARFRQKAHRRIDFSQVHGASQPEWDRTLCRCSRHCSHYFPGIDVDSLHLKEATLQRCSTSSFARALYYRHQNSRSSCL